MNELSQDRGDGPKAGMSGASEVARACNGGPITVVQNRFWNRNIFHLTPGSNCPLCRTIGGSRFQAFHF